MLQSLVVFAGHFAALVWPPSFGALSCALRRCCCLAAARLASPICFFVALVREIHFDRRLISVDRSLIGILVCMHSIPLFHLVFDENDKSEWDADLRPRMHAGLSVRT